MERNLSDTEGPIPPIEEPPEISDLAKIEHDEILMERIRDIRRRSLVRDVSMFTKLGIAVLLTLGLALSVLTFFVHHLTTLQWLTDIQLQNVESLFRFAITGFSFFLAGRYRAIERFLSGDDDTDG